MKKSLLTLALAATLSAPAFAADQYLVRVPANVNLSAAAPETPQEPISLSLSAEALPAATVNEPYSFNLLDRLTITGGSGSHNYSDTAWSLKAGDVLPPGLSLSGSMIAGTPTAKNEAGTSFEVTGTYQDASGQQVYTIVVGGQALKATQVATDGTMSCALTSAKAVKCWGNFIYGVDNEVVQTSSPINISGWESGIERIAVGGGRACAITSSGTLECFGSGSSSGKMGDGGPWSRGLPVVIQGLPSRALEVSIGKYTGCVRLDQDDVWCWGNNNYGQVGDGTTQNRFSPVKVSNLLAKSISAGDSSVCAVDAGNRAFCWGSNAYGRLGDGTQENRSAPTLVLGLSATVKTVHAGHSFSCALMNDGALKCWGGNWYGQLGNGGTTNSSLPMNVSGLQTGVLKVELGSHHACAFQDNQGVLCWGANHGKQLGNPSVGAISLIPVHVTDLNKGAASLSAGDTASCAITLTGLTKCWGNNDAGQLGDGTTVTRTTPVDVLP